MLQILLTRIFSFTIWYHLAYLTVSTALLGFGAAGTLLATKPSLYLNGINRLCGFSAAAAGISSLICMALLGPNPLEPTLMLSRPVTFFFGLLIYYILIAIPFVAAGLSIAAPLAAFPKQANKLYAVDLLGAGIGCLVAIAALKYMDASAALNTCAAIFMLSGALYISSRKAQGSLLVVAVLLLVCAPMANRVIILNPTKSKDVSDAYYQPESKIVFSQWSPINRVDVSVPRYPSMSFWNLFGINPDIKAVGPNTLSINYDGHNGSGIYITKTLDSLNWLEHHILKVPYLLVDEPEVLIIGLGGGIDVINALRNDARKITAAELQPLTLYVHRTIVRDFVESYLFDERVDLVVAEGRHFVRSRDATYDLIQITTTDTFSAQTTGAYVLAESFLYTIDAFKDYLDHLNEDGLVALVVGDVSYRDADIPLALATRLALSARMALQDSGISEPSRHIAVVGIRPKILGGKESNLHPDEQRESDSVGSMLSMVLVKKSPFTAEEVSVLNTYAKENGQELFVAPGLEKENTTLALLNTPMDALPEALRALPIAVHPQSDDEPFFYNVLRWSSVLTGHEIIWFFPGSTTGQIVLMMMLAQAIFFGGLLVLLPILRTGRRDITRASAMGYLIYFLSLGIGFMFFEISFVQKYVLFLGYPTYSLSVTIFSLLIFTGLGAWVSPIGWHRPRTLLIALVTATISLAAIEIFIMPGVRQALLGESFQLRVLLTVAFQAPFGFCLGMYFTTGVEILRLRNPRLIPWAWAVNGVGSVASSVLAVMLAMAVGFTGVTLAACITYLVGVVSMCTVLTFSKVAVSSDDS